MKQSLCLSHRIADQLLENKYPDLFICESLAANTVP